MPPAAQQSPPLGDNRASVKRGLQAGDEGYLWALVFLEIVVLVTLRQGFKRNHGG